MPQSFAEHLKSFPLSPNLGQSLERAHGFAREQSHKLVTLEHLLLALTEDPEAVIITQSANVDLARLTTNVSDHLCRLMEDMRADGAVEPRPAPAVVPGPPRPVAPRVGADAGRGRRSSGPDPDPSQRRAKAGTGIARTGGIGGTDGRG